MGKIDMGKRKRWTRGITDTCPPKPRTDIIGAAETFGLEIDSVQALMESPFKELCKAVTGRWSHDRRALTELVEWVHALKITARCPKTALKIRTLSKKELKKCTNLCQNVAFMDMEEEVKDHWKVGVPVQSAQLEQFTYFTDWFADDLKKREHAKIVLQGGNKLDTDTIEGRLKRVVSRITPSGLKDLLGTVKEREYIEGAARRIAVLLGTDYCKPNYCSATKQADHPDKQEPPAVLDADKLAHQIQTSVADPHLLAAIKSFWEKAMEPGVPEPCGLSADNLALVGIGKSKKKKYTAESVVASGLHPFEMNLSFRVNYDDLKNVVTDQGEGYSSEIMKRFLRFKNRDRDILPAQVTEVLKLEDPEVVTALQEAFVEAVDSMVCPSND